MWIERTSSGTLRYVDRIKVDGKYKKFSTAIEKDTAQARRAAAERLQQKAMAESHDPTEMSLKKAVEDYLKLKDCRESTRIYLRGQFRVIEDVLGDVPLQTLTPAYVRRSFYGSTKKHSVLNRALNSFKTFCDWCVGMEYMEKSPAAGVKRLKDEKPEKDPEELYLEADQLKTLLDGLTGMPYYMTRFLALTGMRIGEASALDVSDITDTYIIVSKAFSCDSGEITKPKNVSSIRKVFIQPELRELLDEFLQWRRLNQMAHGIRTERLFYSRTGTIYTERYYRRSIMRFGVHPHMMRHTHVALLAEQGISLEAIARRIGHTGTETTKRVYYHVTAKQKEKDESMIAAVRIL